MFETAGLWRAAGAVCFAAAACIALVPPAQAAAIESPPTVEVRPDSHGASGLVRGQVDIDATPEAVWKILIDCAQVPHLMVGVKFCHVLQRDPGGKWDLREQVTNASLLPGVRTVIRSDYDEPRSVRFHRTDGDFKILEGEWRLEPLDGGVRTRVYYESRMDAPFAAPNALVRMVLRADMPKTLSNLRTACEASAARP